MPATRRWRTEDTEGDLFYGVGSPPELFVRTRFNLDPLEARAVIDQFEPVRDVYAQNARYSFYPANQPDYLGFVANKPRWTKQSDSPVWHWTLSA